MDFEDNAPAVTRLPAEGLSQVSVLAAEQSRLEQEVSDAEAKLKNLKDELRKCAEERLPDAMLALGLESLTLDDGSRVNIRTDYHASIPAALEVKAFGWLREHNAESMIKNEIKAMFGKGEDALAAAMIQFAQGNKIDIKTKQAVHPQTLKAFVKENAEAGKPVPEDLFGVFVQKRAQITRRQ